ncbi:MAG: histidine--tRNA ligase [Gaiellaceae bacterium]|jgi:histidyl-tRNA synthetase
MSFEAPKGTHDVLPREWPAWQRVLVEAERLCNAYGYRRIATPTFEETELFARSSGEASDIVAKEMYSFEDRGERSLTLRPEATAQICRAYIEHGLQREPQPVKTWMVAPMFRYAKPQKGRYREFWQLDVEAIGCEDPAVDAELIALQAAWLGALGIETTLLLNSIGDRACRPAYLARLETWLDEHSSALDTEARHKRATSPLRVFDTKNPALAALLEGAPTIGDALCADCREHFEAVRRYLDACGVAYTLAPRLVRGLDYYTRTTFEFIAAGLGAQDTVSAGGRYDYLVETIGGLPTPAVGFASGIERIVLSVGENAEEVERGIDVFFKVAPEEREAAMAAMFPVISSLRAKGISCETDYAGRSAKGQETHASRLRARVVVEAEPRFAGVEKRLPVRGNVVVLPYRQVESVVIQLLESDS